MKIIGLTGGIGSGKTTVAGFFRELGISIYIADTAAKELMMTDNYLVVEIKKLLGEESYINGKLHREWISQKVFNDKKLLAGLNAIVHPAVALDFKKWTSKQESPYVIKEAAILFENGGYKKCDYLVLVTAPRNTRVERVMSRDNITKEQVVTRMSAQWSDTRKKSLSDAIIENSYLPIAKEKVIQLHKHLLRRIELGW